MGFHGKDLRKGRTSEEGRIYLVTTVVQDRNPLFTDWDLADLTVQASYSVERVDPISTLAWVLMPDHLHWMFQLNEGDISGVMRRFKSNSARAVNKVSGHSGAVWQKGFHDRSIREDEDMVAAARYVIANPLRAGLVKQIGDYPFWNAIWL